MLLISFWKVFLIHLLCLNSFILINSGNVGTGKKRVIGGSDAPPGKYPAQVSLQFGDMGHYCGGTLLTLSIALTAAHCLIYGETIMSIYVVVMAGEVNSRYNTSETRQTLKILNFAMHPEYDCMTFKNDVALLKMAGAFNKTQFVGTMERTTKRPRFREHCYIIGWGAVNPDYLNEAAEVLQYAEVLIQSPSACGTLKGKSYSFFEAQMICAGAILKRGICAGDSGGPLICNNRIAGIASSGFMPCVVRGGAGRFMDVVAFRKFIDEYLRKDGQLSAETLSNNSIEHEPTKRLILFLIVYLICLMRW